MLNCAFCRFGQEPFGNVPASFVIDGVSVCEDHVDAVSGSGFGRDLSIFIREQEDNTNG